VIAAIAPVYQESPQAIQSLIEHLTSFENICEIVIVATRQDSSLTAVTSLFSNLTDQNQIKLVVSESAGRATQMNAGANSTTASVLLFVHSDTFLPARADKLIIESLCTYKWGRFDVQLDDTGFSFKIISWFMNKRSRLSGISTGDQAIFCNRELFEELDGYPQQPLMEDIEFCKRAKKQGPPALINASVVTSARRWKKAGMVKTVLLMWWLRALYWLGVKPEKLAMMYRQVR